MSPKKGTLVEDEKYPLVSIKTNTTFLLNIFIPVSYIAGEGRLFPSEEGLGVTKLDGSHICLIDFWWDKTDCESYICDPSAIGLRDYYINFEDLVKRIKSIKVVKKRSKMVREKRTDKKLPPVTKRVVINEGKNEKCDLILYRSHLKIVTDTYTVRLKCLNDADEDDIKMESLNGMEFDNEFETTIDEVKDANTSIGVISECVMTVVKNNQMYFIADAYNNSMIIKLKGEMNRCEASGCHIQYAYQFLNDIFGHQKIGKKVKMQFKEESPLRIDVNFGVNSHYIYFLAPRVEEESSLEQELEPLLDETDELIETI